MNRILFVTPGSEYGSSATQLRLLALGLPRDRFDVRACMLGPNGPADKALAAAGVAVEVLGWTRVFDGRPLWNLRRLVCDYRPDVIHVWEPLALRAVRAISAGLAAGPRVARPFRLVVSASLPPQPGGAWKVFDRWLLARADRVVAGGRAEAERGRPLIISPERVTVIAPGVEVPGVEPAQRETLARSLARRLPPGARLLACVGPFERHKGFRDALWAYDILRYLYNDLHLLLIGTGSDQERLEHFVRTIGAERNVHWLGPRADVTALLGLVEAVWVPSRGGGGVHAALEAQAAGTPVVASHLPALAEVVLDGETGFLVPPGDKVALARRTRQLLEDPEQRRRLGRRGRQHVAGRFAATDLVRRFAQLYDTVLAA